MTFAVGTHEWNTTSGSGLTTWDSVNFTAVAGDTLIAIVTYQGATAVLSSLQDTVGGNDTWTEITGAANSDATTKVRAWYLEGAAAGSCTIRATWTTSTVNFPSMLIVPVSGLATGGPIDAISSLQTTPTTATDAVTSGTLVFGADSAPAAVFGFSRNEGSGAQPNAGTNFTGLDVASVRVDFEHKRVTTEDNTAATFTNTGASADDHITIGILWGEAETTVQMGRRIYILP